MMLKWELPAACDGIIKHRLKLTGCRRRRRLLTTPPRSIVGRDARKHADYEAPTPLRRCRSGEASRHSRHRPTAAAAQQVTGLPGGHSGAARSEAGLSSGAARQHQRGEG